MCRRDEREKGRRSMFNRRSVREKKVQLGSIVASRPVPRLPLLANASRPRWCYPTDAAAMNGGSSATPIDARSFDLVEYHCGKYSNSSLYVCTDVANPAAKMCRRPKWERFVALLVGKMLSRLPLALGLGRLGRASLLFLSATPAPARHAHAHHTGQWRPQENSAARGVAIRRNTADQEDLVNWPSGAAQFPAVPADDKKPRHAAEARSQRRGARVDVSGFYNMDATGYGRKGNSNELP